MITWIALFSQTGSELQALKNEGLVPHFVFTNQKNKDVIPTPLQDECVYLTHQEIMDELLGIINNTSGKIIITLHGYLRIIPSEIINNTSVEIYNSHPGDTENYPELRGKDPQEKALRMHLGSTGVVIHRVDEGVDTGEIIYRRPYKITKNTSLTSLVIDLRLISIEMWCIFLKDIMKD